MKKKSMLKFLSVLPILMSLSSCNYQFDKIFIKNSEWKDDAGIVDIFFEGEKTYTGSGTILISGEYKKAEFMFSTYSSEAWVNFVENTGDLYSISQPKISLYYGPKKISSFNYDYSVLKLVVKGGNDSNDSLWNERQIYINRSAIPDSELDAKYYYNASFCNDEIDLQFEYDAYDYEANVLTHVITGTYGNEEATLSYLYNNKFTIYSEDILLANGTYDTYDDKVILNLEEGTLLDEGHPFIELEIYYYNRG